MSHRRAEVRLSPDATEVTERDHRGSRCDNGEGKSFTLQRDHVRTRLATSHKDLPWLRSAMLEGWRLQRCSVGTYTFDRRSESKSLTVGFRCCLCGSAWCFECGLRRCRCHGVSNAHDCKCILPDSPAERFSCTSCKIEFGSWAWQCVPCGGTLCNTCAMKDCSGPHDG